MKTLLQVTLFIAFCVAGGATPMLIDTIIKAASLGFGYAVLASILPAITVPFCVGYLMHLGTAIHDFMQEDYQEPRAQTLHLVVDDEILTERMTIVPNAPIS